VFTNPAGISFINDWSLSGTSQTILGDTRKNIFSGAYNTDFGYMGIGFVDVSMNGSFGTMRDPSNLGRIIIDPSLGVYGQDNNVAVFSFARTIPYKGSVSIGGSLKVFNQSLTGSSDVASRGSASSIDFGAVYTPLEYPFIKASFVYQNLLSSSLSWSGASNATDSIGGYTMFGVTGKIFGKNSYISNINTKKYTNYYLTDVEIEDLANMDQKGDLTAGIDLKLPRTIMSASDTFLLNIGIEWKPAKNLSLRAGIDRAAASTDITYGIGIENKGFGFDYAYKGNGFDPGASHLFTMSYTPTLVFATTINLLKKGPYALKLSPSEKTTIISASDTIKISGTIDNAFNVTGLMINNVTSMPFTSGNQFETTVKGIQTGQSYIKVEVLVSSPETGSASSGFRVFKPTLISDVSPEYFSYNAISYLNYLGLMKGYANGSFKPNSPITRAELVTLLVKAKGLKYEGISFESVFKDMPKSNWASVFAYLSSKEKIVGGYPDKTFKPSKSVTRAEAAVVFSKFEGLTMSSMEFPVYNDVKVTSWVMPSNAAKKAGLPDFINTSSFEANKPMTRGEVAYMLYKTKITGKLIEDGFEKAKNNIQPIEVDIADTTKLDSIVAYGKIDTSEVSSIKINSKFVFLRPQTTTYSQKIDLSSGENTLEVTVSDKKNNILKSIFRKVTKAL